MTYRSPYTNYTIQKDTLLDVFPCIMVLHRLSSRNPLQGEEGEGAQAGVG